MDRPAGRWGAATKRTVALVILVFAALLVYRFHEVLPPLVLALLLAFVVEPVVRLLVNRLHLSRGLASAIVFIVLILAGLAVLAAPVTAVPTIQRLVLSVQVDTLRIINEIGAFLERPVEVAGYTVDLSPLYEELSKMLTTFVGSVAQGTLDVVFAVASGAIWLIFILIVAFYFVKDGPQLIRTLDNLAPPGYRDDVERLRHRVVGVWNAFLRGQLLLCLAVAVLTTIGCSAVGLPYAPILGLLAGMLEVVPNIGPTIASVPAVLLALFRGSTFLPLGRIWFTVLVVALYVIIQQIENNFLVPRIIGGSLNIHPILVLTGVVVGGRLAGILGMLLAAPVIATLLVLARYVFARLYDRDPFAELEPELEPERPPPGLIRQAGEAAVRRLRSHVSEDESTGDAPQTDSVPTEDSAANSRD
ncbi:MAG: AI-2E family transporter [Chloroflexi bacterium]|nr:AI-2E family transporter [Chloroflexota bacterium]